ncbi:hypothetical protein [Methylobacterium sp. Leaf113]|uniref:hypothetical protein n=1 Tax=Methylobacterium sp. Leaf113 TaxID=1736259 RepID=UPI001FCE2D6D|nr:hypothetical protein [Methylobacterium sp. Leaf113]
MGAGNLMSVSLEKPANALVRLHMAVEQATHQHTSAYTLPINDGVFIICPSTFEIQTVVQSIMIDLAAIFISTPDPQNKFLLRGAIAYGPVYRGDAIAAGLSPAKRVKHQQTLSRVAFGPAIIQAFRSESNAPPYGIAIHESARAFAPPNSSPFLMSHWLWWIAHADLKQPSGAPPLSVLKDVLCSDILSHFKWLRSTLIMHGITNEKVSQWEQMVQQYFRYWPSNS